jgi:hypothetical protein
MTTTTATTPGTILALDLGKYKTVACAADRASADARFDTLTTSHHERRGFLGRTQPIIVLEAERSVTANSGCSRSRAPGASCGSQTRPGVRPGAVIAPFHRCPRDA